MNGGVDPEYAEEFAERAGIDPTPQQIEDYRLLEGDEPLGDGTGDVPSPAGAEVTVQGTTSPDLPRDDPGARLDEA